MSITAVGSNKTQLDDFIYGDDGDDTIYGQDGSDHISGGDDNDELVGGPGANFFDCGSGLDVVKDFNATEGDVYMPNCEIIQDENDWLICQSKSNLLESEIYKIVTESIHNY